MQPQAAVCRGRSLSTPILKSEHTRRGRFETCPDRVYFEIHIWDLLDTPFRGIQIFLIEHQHLL